MPVRAASVATGITLGLLFPSGYLFQVASHNQFVPLMNWEQADEENAANVLQFSHRGSGRRDANSCSPESACG